MIDRICTLGETSVIGRVKLRRSDTGQGLVGLTSASSGLIIGTLCDNEAAATVYTVAASHIETIATLATYAAPSASCCRFKEVDATNHPGTYEFQLADARYAVAGAKVLRVSFLGAANLLEKEYKVLFIAANLQDGVRLGLTALPNAVPDANGGLPLTNGTKLNKTVDLTAGQSIAASSVPAELATAANQTTILNAVNAITTSTARSAPRCPEFMPRPPTGSIIYLVELFLYNLKGVLEDADSNTVTIHARNSAGTSRDSGLASTTMTRVAAGQYRVAYTVAYTDTAEAVYFDYTWAISSVAMADGAVTQVQDAENYTTLAAIKTQTDKMLFDASSYIKSVEQVQTGLSTFNSASDTVKANIVSTDNIDFSITQKASIKAQAQDGLATVPEMQANLATGNEVTAAKEEIKAKFPNVQVLTEAGWKNITG